MTCRKALVERTAVLARRLEAISALVERQDAEIRSLRAVPPGGTLWLLGTRGATISPMTPPRFPGEDLIAEGLRDLGRRTPTLAALLVSLGAPRLRQLGFTVTDPFPDPEHALYLLLAREAPATAHSRYNALVRRLVSFERAAACAG